jgi:prevent-host-death family protein
VRRFLPREAAPPRHARNRGDHQQTGSRDHGRQLVDGVLVWLDAVRPREVAFRNELVNNMVMGKVNIFEVKAKLSEYLDRAAAGERILICRHNTPVAELRPVDAARTTERPIGPLEGRPTFELPASFFEPMADDDVELWEGGGDAGTWPADTPRRPSRVAEAPGSHGTARGRRPAKRRR